MSSCLCPVEAEEKRELFPLPKKSSGGCVGKVRVFASPNTAFVFWTQPHLFGRVPTSSAAQSAAPGCFVGANLFTMNINNFNIE